MKYCLAIVILFLACTMYGQTRDRRALLDINGRVEEISVSPNEEIWLVSATGHAYYTKSIDSNWITDRSLSKKNDEEYRHQSYERISFFDKDTAILSGYISAVDTGYNPRKNGYYRTTDAGKTWNLMDYGGNSWIYTICTSDQGHAWMGGLSKQVFYTKDYGRSWTTKQLPYSSSDRTYGISMRSSGIGVASSDNNEIVATTDNWSSVTHLPTPLDQNLIQANREIQSTDNRISKIALWNEFIIVKQAGRVFITPRHHISWARFHHDIYDFAIDANTQKLFAVKADLTVLAFTSPIAFHDIRSEALSCHPVDLKAINNSLFVLCLNNEVYKVSESRFIRTRPYTLDFAIPEPTFVMRSGGMKWGVSGDHIYMADDDSSGWYRDNVLGFYVGGCKQISDSAAILWDGLNTNYLYSIYDRKSTKYVPTFSLSDFVSSPTASLSISSVGRGCFNYDNDIIVYSRTSDTTLQSTNVSISSNANPRPSRFKRSIRVDSVLQVLDDINSNPATIPSMRDFRITSKDKSNYRSMVDANVRNNKKYNEFAENSFDKSFYYSVPNMLDSLPDSILTQVLNSRERFASTSSSTIAVQLVNNNGDTLIASRHSYSNGYPWNLPWKIEYKGLTFTNYSIEFSRFINSCLPDGFMGKEVFDNRMLIMKIANYLNALRE
ncbi:MAG TPA: hypothetical protein VK147_03115 [Candidatus Didemnitutus sp.]|nr:hypothetical protein [Candidatus Didemnitutus sp.]